ncbi:MAG: GNAT family N-acetyltransferase [Aeriscardovia sp.]|nr:GNAT family N-acetyltransferase [Aeriscardovia sp.]
MIRYALEQDAQALVKLRIAEQKELHPQAGADPGKVKAIEKWISESVGNVNVLMLVSEAEGKIGAICTFVIEHNIPGLVDNGNYAYMCNVYTVPEQRKQGIMSDMISQGEIELKARNVCAVYFDSVSPSMISLSQKMGYVHRTSFYSKDLSD